MKKLWCVIAFVLVLLIFKSSFTEANSAARGWCEYGNQTVSTGGLTSTTKVQKSFPSCTVTVYLAGTSTPATIYQVFDDSLVRVRYHDSHLIWNSDSIFDKSLTFINQNAAFTIKKACKIRKFIFTDHWKTLAVK